MAVKRIQVRALPGRVAYTAPVGGKIIPEDAEGVQVEHNRWIERLLTIQGDIEIVKPKVAAKAVQPTESK